MVLFPLRIITYFYVFLLTYVFLRVIMASRGEGMKRKDIDKVLRKAGWVIIHGGNHDLVQHPQKPGVKIPIPRHTEVNEQTARGILRQAGIK